MSTQRQSQLGPILFFGSMLFLGIYFAFSAIQGDYGVFRRADVEAETQALRHELADVKADVARMENLTHRLSDDYLDLDLLDERARDMLGLLRGDEIVVR